MKLSGKESPILRLVELLIADLLQLDLLPANLLDVSDVLTRGEDLRHDLDVLTCTNYSFQFFQHSPIQ